MIEEVVDLVLIEIDEDGVDLNAIDKLTLEQQFQVCFKNENPIT